MAGNRTIAGGLVAAALLFLTTASWAKDVQAGLAKVDQMFAAEMERLKFGSFTVGIVSGPDLIWTKSYGMADAEKKSPATKDTIYRIGSITKEFTAIMLWQLVQQGKVHFSEPAEKYLPEIKLIPNAYPYASPVTLVQLASHTSGLAREPEPVEVYTRGPVADWEKILISSFKDHMSYAYEPGTRFFYSNIGYAILGATLSRAAGEPYTQYVQKHILAPLGMTHTVFEPTAETLKTLAKGYTVDKDGKADFAIAARELKDGRGYKVPNGALFTTVADLAHFVSFQMGDAPDEKVLPKATIKEYTGRLLSATAELESGYGIGISGQRHGEFVTMGHGGSVAGFLSQAIFDPKTHMGLVMLYSAIARYDAKLPYAALEAVTK